MEDLHEKKALEQARVLSAYNSFFNSEDGQVILRDLMNQFHYWQTSYTGNKEDCLFREGGRNTVNYILQKSMQDSELVYRTFLKEYARQKEKLNEYYN